MAETRKRRGMTLGEAKKRGTRKGMSLAEAAKKAGARGKRLGRDLTVTERAEAVRKSRGGRGSGSVTRPFRTSKGRSSARRRARQTRN